MSTVAGYEPRTLEWQLDTIPTRSCTDACYCVIISFHLFLGSRHNLHGASFAGKRIIAIVILAMSLCLLIFLIFWYLWVKAICIV